MKQPSVLHALFMVELSCSPAGFVPIDACWLLGLGFWWCSVWVIASFILKNSYNSVCFSCPVPVEFVPSVSFFWNHSFSTWTYAIWAFNSFKTLSSVGWCREPIKSKTRLPNSSFSNGNCPAYASLSLKSDFLKLLALLQCFHSTDQSTPDI